MKDNEFFEGLGALAALAGVIALIVFAPMISFFISYFGGWLCKITFGNILCNGLNTLFHVAWFEPDKLPIMAGALGWIGGFFKSIDFSINKD